jgi:hypothetical protein
MAAEPVKNAGSRAAGVDECRRSAASRHLDRIDTQRGPAPVDMRVEVNQPRHDEQPARIDDLGIFDGVVTPDFGYLSVAEGDVGRLVAPTRGIDDAAASEDQIPHMRALLPHSGAPFEGRERDEDLGSAEASGAPTTVVRNELKRELKA